MVKEIKIEDIKYLFRKREIDANKGDFGKVGILGGSIRYSGAVKLANMSLCTLRSGAGLVRVIVPKTIIDLLSPYLLEQTLYPYENVEDIKEAIKNLSSLSVGMGWDYDEKHLSVLQYVLENFNGNLILDADALNTLVGHLDLLRKSNANIILTPHLKEFSRLTGLSIDNIKNDEVRVAKDFARENHIILVLKGHTTIVTDGIDVYLCRCGTPGMATSGSGDVLSGILAGMLGYLDCNLLTVSAGVFVNGIAGEIAEMKNTDICMIASDTIHSIPLAIKRIRGEDKATFDDFLKLDIRVGTIIKVEDFLNAKRPAYKLEIDFGELGLKKSSAQITELYQKDELVGKQILAVVNFPKKQIADFMSEVLVLGVYSKNGVVLIEPNKPVNNGEKLG